MQVFTVLLSFALTALMGLVVAVPTSTVSTSPPLPHMWDGKTISDVPQSSTTSPSFSHGHGIHTKIVRSVVTVLVTTTINVATEDAPPSSSSTNPTSFSTAASTTASALKAAITIGAGFDVASYASGNIIRAPLDCHGQNTYLGVKKYRDGNFDAARCVEVCRVDDECHFVNTWMWHRNGTAMEQHCALYSKSWPNQFLVPVIDYVRDIEASDSWGYVDLRRLCVRCTDDT